YWQIEPGLSFHIPKNLGGNPEGQTSYGDSVRLPHFHDGIPNPVLQQSPLWEAYRSDSLNPNPFSVLWGVLPPQKPPGIDLDVLSHGRGAKIYRAVRGKQGHL